MPKSKHRKLSAEKIERINKRKERIRLMFALKGQRWRTTPRQDLYTKGISSRARSVRETFVKDAAEQEGFEKFYRLLYSPSARKEGEDRETYRERLWLRAQAFKVWKQSFKGRNPNNILKFTVNG